MKFKSILVTGGAGFVGTHLCRELIKKGVRVRAFDNLDPQVHGKGARRPSTLPRAVKFIKGDVTNPKAVDKALNGVDAVVHLAAAVGVGQSMYQIRHYVNANSMGGATLLEAVLKKKKNIKKMIVASSMSIYGEGLYRCGKCGKFNPELRPESQLKKRQWEFRCPTCRSVAEPIPTPESKPLFPTSIYAVTKRDHEENFLSVGRAYGIPTTALRFFNIYGPYQALSNPYTGVAAIFSSRLLNHEAPLVFEDGKQSRDFIHVSDIVQGIILSLEKPAANYEVFNVGTGRSTSVAEVAGHLSTHLKLSIKPRILNKYRAGDIRHCYANIQKIKSKLGFSPRVPLEKGVSDLIYWVRQQKGTDHVSKAVGELNKFGLVR